MSKPLFSESALETLSSPEQLDQLIKIIRPKSWIILSALGFMLGITIIWSIFGSLPTTATGSGLIIRTDGVFHIYSLGNGVVTKFKDLKVGDIIHEGDVIGHIAQPIMEQSIEMAKNEVSRLEKANASILLEIDQQKIMQHNSMNKQISIQSSIIHAKEDELKSLKKVSESYEVLLKNGLITSHDFEQTKRNIFKVENDISNANNELQNIMIQNLTIDGVLKERIYQSSSSLLNAKNNLKDLQKRYNIQSDLISMKDGVVVENLVSVGDVVNENQPVLTFESVSHHLQALIYMSDAGQAKRIHPDMDVKIAISTAEKERYGYILGKVNVVSKYASTEQAMMTVIHHQGIVNEMSKFGPPFTIVVDLVPDASTVSGYRWSSKNGSQVKFWSGTRCEGVFTIEIQKPISLIIPFLKKSVGL